MLQCLQINGKYMQPMVKQLTKQYGWRVHTMNELMVSLQGWGGNTDEDILFWSCSKK
jgi:hypothetical protein